MYVYWYILWRENYINSGKFIPWYHRYGARVVRWYVLGHENHINSGGTVFNHYRHSATIYVRGNIYRYNRTDINSGGAVWWCDRRTRQMRIQRCVPQHRRKIVASQFVPEFKWQTGILFIEKYVRVGKYPVWLCPCKYVYKPGQHRLQRGPNGQYICSNGVGNIMSGGKVSISDRV